MDETSFSKEEILDIIKISVCVSVLIVMFICVLQVAYSMSRYKKEDSLNKEIAQTYTSENASPNYLAVPSSIPENADGNQPKENAATNDSFQTTNDIPPISIDFDSLKNVNKDIVGWIYCEGTDINYPILQSNDNEFYLHHDLNKEYRTTGSIFLDYENASDFSQATSILYGHHVKGSAMFGCIDKWMDADFFKEHSFMWLYTPDKIYKINLCSIYITPETDSVTYDIYEDGSELVENFVSHISEKASIKTGGTLSSNQKYIILSTCNYSFTGAREVLIGYLTLI